MIACSLLFAFPLAAASFIAPPVAAAGSDVVILWEDFEGAWPEAWEVSDDLAPGGVDTWGISDLNTYQGGGSAWCAQVGDGDTGANSVTHRYDRSMSANLLVPLGDLSGFSSLNLTFRYWAELGNGDHITLYDWHDGGGDILWQEPSSSSGGWQEAVVPIPPTSTMLNFLFYSDPSPGQVGGVYLDDIELTGLDSAAPASSIGTMGGYMSSPSFPVPVAAADPGGSGVAYVELFYSRGGEFVRYTTSYNPDGRWQAGTIEFDTASLGGDGWYEFYTVAFDGAGNAEAAATGRYVSTLVDTAAPVTEALIDGMSPSSGWYASGVEVVLEAVPDESEIERTEYRLDGGEWTTYAGPIAIADEGIHSLQFRSLDKAGNLEAVREAFIHIDLTAPSVWYSATEGEAAYGWYPSEVHVELHGEDLTSGLASIKYSLDNVTWQDYSGPVLISGEGTHWISYYGTDIAGNGEGAVNGTNVRIDLTAPRTEYQGTGEQHSNGWYTTPVTIELVASDGLSGMQGIKYSLNGMATWQDYTGPFEVGKEGDNMVIFYAVDKAGNREAYRTVNYLVDLLPPIIDFDIDGGTVFLTDSPVVSWSVRDDASGVSRVEISLDQDDFGEIPTYKRKMSWENMSWGQHVLRVRAYDIMGNMAEEELMFTVERPKSPLGPFADLNIRLEDVFIACLLVGVLAGCLGMVYLHRSGALRPRPKRPSAKDDGPTVDPLPKKKAVAERDRPERSARQVKRSPLKKKAKVITPDPASLILATKNCPNCGRTVLAIEPECVYCGASLPVAPEDYVERKGWGKRR